jgi:hypothetical protein
MGTSGTGHCRVPVSKVPDPSGVGDTTSWWRHKKLAKPDLVSRAAAKIFSAAHHQPGGHLFALKLAKKRPQRGGELRPLGGACRIGAAATVT